MGTLELVASSHQLDNLCQGGIVAHLGCLHLEKAGLADGGTDDLIANVLFHRDALTG